LSIWGLERPQQRITDIFVHKHTGTTVYLGKGVKATLPKAIEMIENGNVLTTIR
jgi:hypothetical protein